MAGNICQALPDTQEPAFPLATCFQRLTLVHFSSQREHCLWDALGTFSGRMGHNSSTSQTGLRTAG
jgi:hypothetical protein